MRAILVPLCLVALAAISVRAGDVTAAVMPSVAAVATAAKPDTGAVTAPKPAAIAAPKPDTGATAVTAPKPDASKPGAGAAPKPAAGALAAPKPAAGALAAPKPDAPKPATGAVAAPRPDASKPAARAAARGNAARGAARRNPGAGPKPASGARAQGGHKYKCESEPYAPGVCTFCDTNVLGGTGSPATCPSPFPGANNPPGIVTSCNLNGTAACHTKNYTDDVPRPNFGAPYCMPEIQETCANPANIGCATRCALYVLTQYHCVADAYDLKTGTYNPNCIYCNMCWRGFNDGLAAKKAPYFLVLGRDGALYQNHWLVIPKTPCVGVESKDPKCTGPDGEFIWGNTWFESGRLNFTYSGGEPDWAIMLNAPNRRGNQQMHIHIAPFSEADRQPTPTPPIPVKDYLVSRIAAADSISDSPCSPSFFEGSGYVYPGNTQPPPNWAQAYVAFFPTSDPAKDLGTKIKPFSIAKVLLANSDLPEDASYGIILMPRTYGSTPGVIVGIVWSTSDYEQLSQETRPGDPIKYSRSCWNYVGVPLPN